MGMQGHMGASPTGIPSIQAALQCYSYAFPDLNIRVTEFTVDTDDEDLQADYTRDFYTMLFSHPEVVSVQFWGFWAKEIEDNDGWSNRYEYGFALQHGVHETSLLRSVEYDPANDSLEVQYARKLGVSDLSHRLETSTDLSNWTQTASAETLTTESSHSVLELTIQSYLRDQQRRFIRLVATQGE
jgi:hypothetical protein